VRRNHQQPVRTRRRELKLQTSSHRLPESGSHNHHNPPSCTHLLVRQQRAQQSHPPCKPQAKVLPTRTAVQSAHPAASVPADALDPAPQTHSADCTWGWRNQHVATPKNSQPA
jgi:hypothetical protein